MNLDHTQIVIFGWFNFSFKFCRNEFDLFVIILSYLILVRLLLLLCYLYILELQSNMVRFLFMVDVMVFGVAPAVFVLSAELSALPWARTRKVMHNKKYRLIKRTLDDFLVISNDGSLQKVAHTWIFPSRNSHK